MINGTPKHGLASFMTIQITVVGSLMATSQQGQAIITAPITTHTLHLAESVRRGRGKTAVRRSLTALHRRETARFRMSAMIPGLAQSQQSEFQCQTILVSPYCPVYLAQGRLSLTKVPGTLLNGIILFTVANGQISLSLRRVPNSKIITARIIPTIQRLQLL
jgi:hypothetical protein